MGSFHTTVDGIGHEEHAAQDERRGQQTTTRCQSDTA